MEALLPGYKFNHPLDDDENIKWHLNIDPTLFDHLDKWVHVRKWEKEVKNGKEKRLLAKHDMRNLVAYSWIYLLGERVVEDKTLKKIRKHVKKLVLSATEEELDGFMKLLGSPDLKRDGKYKKLEGALVMRLARERERDDVLQGVRCGLIGKIRNLFRTT